MQVAGPGALADLHETHGALLRTPEFDRCSPGSILLGDGGAGRRGWMVAPGQQLPSAICILHTASPAPEPNLTVLWSQRCRRHKKYAARVLYRHPSLQYEKRDDLMRSDHSDDYAFACCVSLTVIGKQMQFSAPAPIFAKTLLYAINGGWMRN